MATIAVIDFETNGQMPDQGGRPTEIAVALLSGGRVVGRFQSLMNSQVWISPFVEELTGITNSMARAAPPARQVMAKARDFVDARPMAAHNAAFDSKFWDCEMRRLDSNHTKTEFVCTMLLARRVWPDAPNHKLGTLAELLRLPQTGRAHRAMADTEMACGVLMRIREALRKRHGIHEPPFDLLCELARAPAKKFEQTALDWAGGNIKAQTAPGGHEPH